MRTGIPGFVGFRLTEAIEARGVSSSSLADLLGVSRSAISQYETGQHSPSPDVFERLCKIVNLPPGFFMYREQCELPDLIFLRSMSPAGKTAQLKAARRLNWLRSIASYVRAYVELHELEFPSFSFPQDPARIADDEIESSAVELRAFWKLSDNPIGNFVRVLENNGFIVAYDELEDAMDGLSCFDKSGVPFIITPRASSACQAREDLAYALGHLVLHRSVEKERLAINKDFVLMRRQAFRFAGAFLLPEESFCGDVYAYSLDALRLQKSKWKTPIGLMIRRLEDLGLIDADQAKKLWINRSRRGWRVREPLDEDIPKEQCRLLSDSLQLMIDENAQTKGEVLTALPFNDRDIEVLAGLPTGYLTDNMPVVSIIPAEKRPPVKPTSGEKGQVVAFPQKQRGGKEKQRKAN